jgi:hypothetical protein
MTIDVAQSDRVRGAVRLAADEPEIEDRDQVAVTRSKGSEIETVLDAGRSPLKVLLVLIGVVGLLT